MEDRVEAITADARWQPEQPPALAAMRKRRKPPSQPADADPPAAPDEDYYAPSEPDEDA